MELRKANSEEGSKNANKSNASIRDRIDDSVGEDISENSFDRDYDQTRIETSRTGLIRINENDTNRQLGEGGDPDEVLNSLRTQQDNSELTNQFRQSTINNNTEVIGPTSNDEDAIIISDGGESGNGPSEDQTHLDRMRTNQPTRSSGRTERDSNEALDQSTDIEFHIEVIRSLRNELRLTLVELSDSFPELYPLITTPDTPSHNPAERRTFYERLLFTPEETQGEDCPICLENEGRLRTFPCKHSFHQVCALRWFVDQIKDTCPYCRRHYPFDNGRN